MLRTALQRKRLLQHNAKPKANSSRKPKAKRGRCNSVGAEEGEEGSAAWQRQHIRAFLDTAASAGPLPLLDLDEAWAGCYEFCGMRHALCQ